MAKHYYSKEAKREAFIRAQRKRGKAITMKLDQALASIAPFIAGILMLMALTYIFAGQANAEFSQTYSPFAGDMTDFEDCYRGEIGKENAPCSTYFEGMADVSKDSQTIWRNVYRRLSGESTEKSVGIPNASPAERAFLMLALSRPIEDLRAEVQGDPGDTDIMLRNPHTALKTILKRLDVDPELFINYADACQANGTERFPLETCPNDALLSNPSTQFLGRVAENEASVSATIQRLTADVDLGGGFTYNPCDNLKVSMASEAYTNCIARHFQKDPFRLGAIKHRRQNDTSGIEGSGGARDAR